MLVRLRLQESTCGRCNPFDGASAVNVAGTVRFGAAIIRKSIVTSTNENASAAEKNKRASTYREFCQL